MQKEKKKKKLKQNPAHDRKVDGQENERKQKPVT